MNYKWDEGKLIFELPKRLYNFNLTDRGDVLELRSPLFKEKFGDILGVDNTGVAYNIIELSQRLTSLGYTTALIENKKLFVSKDGVNINLIFSKYLAYENTSVKQIEFTMKGLKKGQEGAFQRIVDGYEKQLKSHLDYLEGVNL